jgi:alpha-tubulin suppressor-like RCC1 family protein
VGHACAVLTGGGLSCWGYNGTGALGNGGINGGACGDAPVTALVTNVVQVSAGAGHTCVVTTAGAVECVGENDDGELGNGSLTNSTSWVTPISSGAIGVACGGYHTCALMAVGPPQCWGYNSNGQVGDGTTMTRTAPVAVVGF